MTQTGSTTEVATLAGGCFWCLEAVYDELQGVHSVESGYMGGHVDNPTYEQVCSGRTGHAEVVRITFDPAIVTYREVLEVFFVIHDPTTLNQQGHDIGTQYRSAIFYHSPEQKQVADDVIATLAADRLFDTPSSRRSPKPAPSTSPRSTTRSTTRGTPSRATAPSSSAPRWPSFARSSSRNSRTTSVHGQRLNPHPAPQAAANSGASNRSAGSTQQRGGPEGPPLSLDASRCD